MHELLVKPPCSFLHLSLFWSLLKKVKTINYLEFSLINCQIHINTRLLKVRFNANSSSHSLSTVI